MILSIDPSFSKGYAYAVFSGVDCAHSGVVKKAKDNTCLNVVNLLAGVILCSPFDIDTVVIEDQYLARSNPDTLKKMVEARTIAEVILHQVFDADVVRISPKTWQTVFGLSGRTRSATLKECSKAYASSYTGRKIISDDESDAICMGSFFTNKYRTHKETIYELNGIEKIYTGGNE